jgi:hypothetical protein
MPSANDGKRTGQSLLPPPRRDSQLSPYLRLNIERRASFFCSVTSKLSHVHNGIHQQVVSAPTVHVMHTKIYAAKFGRLGAAADTQHIEEGQRGGAKHCR